jgi:hypothetical protein
MKDVNEARRDWLESRNADILQECKGLVKRLTFMMDPPVDGMAGHDVNPEALKTFKDWTWTEWSVVNFNSLHEKMILTKYLEGLGYKFQIDYGTDEDVHNLRLKIRIGI